MSLASRNNSQPDTIVGADTGTDNDRSHHGLASKTGTPFVSLLTLCLRTRGRNKSASLIKQLLLVLQCVTVSTVAFAQETTTELERIDGVWRMDPRTLRSIDAVAYQEDGTVTFKQLSDGRLSAIARITTRTVLTSDAKFTDPACESEKECTHDSASEGIGALFRSTLYVDWIDDGWIDDFFKIKGNVMTGDDGNGPIRLVKEEQID